MIIEQTLLQEIDESKRALDGPIDDNIYRREHSKRIELINLGFRKYEKSRYSYL